MRRNANRVIENAMSELVISYLDVTRLAVASFLARYREPTVGSYRVDLQRHETWDLR